MLIEPLSNVFTQIEYLGMLAKVEKNQYLDKQLVKIAMNIIRNINDLKKGQTNWYGKYQKHRLRNILRRTLKQL